MQEFTSLSELLNLFGVLKKVHISVCDFSGILSHPMLKLEFKDRVHSKQFCDIAKSTPRGYKTCIRCKNLANQKAIIGQQIFYGHCPYGMFEIGFPIVENGKVLAVIYVGNIVTDREYSFKRAALTCGKTTVDFNTLSAEFDNACHTSDIQPYLDIAEALNSYINMVLTAFPQSENSDGKHWLVREMKLYAKENFRRPLNLKYISKLYGFNEKYAGRLFKSTTGVSFSQYVNAQRLTAAKRELRETDKTVLEISMNCGFDNVTYFNRLFKTKYGKTPKEYRI